MPNGNRPSGTPTRGRWHVVYDVDGTDVGYASGLDLRHHIEGGAHDRVAKACDAAGHPGRARPHLHGEPVGGPARGAPGSAHGHLLGPRDRRRRGDVRGSQGTRGAGRRGRGPRLHSLPVQQHAGRPVLAARPDLPRLLVAGGRLAQVRERRTGLAGRRRGDPRLLGARGRDPGGGTRSDLVRVVSRLPQRPARQQRRVVDGSPHRLRRDGGRASACSSVLSSASRPSSGRS